MGSINGTNSTGMPTVTIIGGGFSGISALYRCRKLGFDARILERGDDFGGVWYWNRYPGARVDSEWPFYQLNIPEAYESWTFSERFPDHNELRRYINHIDKVLNLRKDTIFDAKVIKATFDAAAAEWTVCTASGLCISSKYLILATGLLHKEYVPDLPGLATYKGRVEHSASYPQDLILQGRKVAVVGSGATAVQIVQSAAKDTAVAGSLTVLMRRPSTCVPLRQQRLSAADQGKWKGYFCTLFNAGRESFTGFPLASTGKMVTQVTEKEREARFEELWQRGAFNFLLAGYIDIAASPEANRAIYDFWARKVRERITDPFKRDIMAPLEPVYPFGTKRPPLEADYYECLDMDHVEIVPLEKNPIKNFVDDGVILQDDTHRQLDVAILATGFDSFTGSLTQLGLKSKDGTDLDEVWSGGVRTHLGMFVNGFPNAFIIYGPQAPTAFSNGPTILECQADLVAETMARMEKEGICSIEATLQAEDDWGKATDATVQGTVMNETNSWWNGGNIPGKKIQTLVFNEGISRYEEICRGKLATWEGFDVSKKTGARLP
ncbi:hypothetical protein CEP52_016112 [Fusarium oligoseptatum]|uniref:FAD/NAD(P)-binding domain-containing protein n=1 Tax=Fusarium oligoseptatum TaxID=2604345 RepID=A0A428S733_9HYPO|nr:hypothetical protein CEP52_016112 [Fusarium oligoseptatum]